MAANAEEDDWDSEAQPHWRGIGISDPIKAVEVRPVLLALTRTCSLTPMSMLCWSAGQMAAAPCLPEGQGPRKAAH